MTLDEAKQLIFKRLCSAYKLHGDEGLVKWRGLPQELEIPEDVFGEAIKALRDGQIIELLLPLHVRLGPLGREQCKR
jgi:hypothetical protein